MKWAVVTVALLLAAGVVAWLGTRDTPSPSAIEMEPMPEVRHGDIVSIELPYEEPTVPPGPNRKTFITSCTVCHSTRLVFTQPRLTPAQWQATIDKMVKVHKADLEETDKKAILSYLTAVMSKNPE